MQTKSAFILQSFPSATLPPALSSPASPKYPSPGTTGRWGCSTCSSFWGRVHNHFSLTSVHNVESTKKYWQVSKRPLPFFWPYQDFESACFPNPSLSNFGHLGKPVCHGWKFCFFCSEPKIRSFFLAPKTRKLKISQIAT